MIGAEGVVGLRSPTEFGPRNNGHFGSHRRGEPLHKCFDRLVEVGQQAGMPTELIAVRIETAV